jgi:hypothetical protein
MVENRLSLIKCHCLDTEFYVIIINYFWIKHCKLLIYNTVWTQWCVYAQIVLKSTS